MIQFQPLSILIDWTAFNFELSIISVTYPIDGMFRSDSIFCVAQINGEFYLEILGITLIGEKGPQ